ncbi:MAG: hypothetical protein RL001_526 [Pseudomonadota bacterium]|nr:hypothetical protein [Oxalobacteraceae bacterium]
MTTKDANIAQSAAEPVMQDESAVLASAAMPELPANAEATAPPAPDLAQTPALLGDADADSNADAAAVLEAGADLDPDLAQVTMTDGEASVAEEVAEPPPPKPIQLIFWNERAPASAGCWVSWREAGFECRGKIEKGLFTATCKGYGGSAKSQPVELLLWRRFVSQGEAIAVMDRTLSFDPLEAENLGFEVHSRVMIPFLQTSGALDEEHTAVGS